MRTNWEAPAYVLGGPRHVALLIWAQLECQTLLFPGRGQLPLTIQNHRVFQNRHAVSKEIIAVKHKIHRELWKEILSISRKTSISMKIWSKRDNNSHTALQRGFFSVRSVQITFSQANIKVRTFHNYQPKDHQKWPHNWSQISLVSCTDFPRMWLTSKLHNVINQLYILLAHNTQLCFLGECPFIVFTILWVAYWEIMNNYSIMIYICINSFVKI